MPPDHPIRVVHVIAQIGVGGAERQLRALVTHSNPSQVRHQVLYYSDARDKDELRSYKDADMDVTRVRRNTLRPLRFVRELASAIRDRSPDVVHCWLSGAALWGRVAAILAGTRHIVVAYRGTKIPQLPVLKPLEWLTAKRVHHMANSRACAQAVAEQLGLPADRFHVIYNGVDTRAFAKTDTRSQLLSELGLPDDRKLVVTVGRRTAAKNYPMLLRIAQRCRGTLPVRFLIAGHDELEGDLHRLAEDLDVTGLVHFLGLRHDVAAILNAADLFCFTSRHEGCPNALLEAMMAGLPIVTTNFPGADELIQDGVNGRMVGVDDVESAYEAIKAYLQDSSQAVRFAENARKTAEERFSMQRMVEETTGLYKKLLDGVK